MIAMGSFHYDGDQLRMSILYSVDDVTDDNEYYAMLDAEYEDMVLEVSIPVQANRSHVRKSFGGA